MHMNEAKKDKMPIFAARFSELRGERTQAEFAQFLGISRATVGFYENGERVPDALVLRQIAERCGVTTDYLVGLSDNRGIDNVNIGRITGLSDAAIDVLKTAVLEKKFLLKTGNVQKCYWADILSKLIESINFFPSLYSDMVRAFNLDCSDILSNCDLWDELETKYPAALDRIIENGTFLSGQEYKMYLLAMIEKDFSKLIEFLCSEINPSSYESGFSKFIREVTKNDTVKARIELDLSAGKGGANNADNPETR